MFSKPNVSDHHFLNNVDVGVPNVYARNKLNLTGRSGLYSFVSVSPAPLPHYHDGFYKFDLRGD